MKFMCRLFYVIAAFCLYLFASLSLSSSAAAQIDTQSIQPEDESFAHEISAINSRAFYPSKVDDAAIWYSMGSKWTLSKASGFAPEALKMQLQRFTWHNEAWEFETKHCYRENSGYMSKAFAATFSQETLSQHDNSPIIIKPRQKSYSTKKPKGCTTLDNRADYKTLAGHFQLSWNIGDPDSLNTISVSLDMPGGKSALLEYTLQTPFSALTQTNWQWDLGDTTLPKTCGLLRVSPQGYASTSCCNGLYFQLKETKGGWESLSGGGTQVGCDALYTNVDNKFYEAMPEGLTLNDNGTLSIGTSKNKRIVLDPVDRFESAYGQWILSGLEMRSANSMIPTRPHIRAVTSRDKMIDMNITLDMTPERLSLSSACASASAPIAARKVMLLRLGKGERARVESCNDSANILTRLSRSFSQITADGATLLVEVDEVSGDLTLTRMKLGEAFRSVHWIFSKADAPIDALEDAP